MSTGSNSNSQVDLVRLLRGLGDPNRLRLLNLLSNGEVCVCHLADSLKMVQPKVSRHLAYLLRAGLVTARRQGKWTYYRGAKHDHPAAGALIDGLQSWMRKHRGLTDERGKLHRLQRRCAPAKRKTSK